MQNSSKLNPDTRFIYKKAETPTMLSATETSAKVIRNLKIYFFLFTSGIISNARLFARLRHFFVRAGLYKIADKVTELNGDYSPSQIYLDR